MRSTRKLALVVPLAIAAAACGTTNPPGELVSARAAYERAAKGPAATYQPADLHDARQALSRAEKSFADDGASDETRHLGYIAERKALLAESLARTTAEGLRQTAAEKERQSLQAKLLEKTQGKLKTAEKKAATAEKHAAKSAAELEAERAARADAEKRAKEATEALSKSMAVKEDPRGLVITLSGSVLFAFGKSELLPSARRRLDEVAEALKNIEDRSFVIEGHTDSVGSDEDNRSLSERRALAVKDYLLSRGVDASRIRAEGKGETAPVETNATAEGRANNRRVEIVVLKPTGETGTQQGGGPPAEQETEPPPEPEPPRTP